MSEFQPKTNTAEPSRSKEHLLTGVKSKATQTMRSFTIMVSRAQKKVVQPSIG